MPDYVLPLFNFRDLEIAKGQGHRRTKNYTAFSYFNVIAPLVILFWVGTLPGILNKNLHTYMDILGYPPPNVLLSSSNSLCFVNLWLTIDLDEKNIQRELWIRNK